MATSLNHRRAQRQLARNIREGRPTLPESIKQSYSRGLRAAVTTNADAIMRGDRPMPAQGTSEAKLLAGLAGKARWGKASPKYEAAFKHLWYHAKDK